MPALPDDPVVPGLSVLYAAGLLSAAEAEEFEERLFRASPAAICEFEQLRQIGDAVLRAAAQSHSPLPLSSEPAGQTVASGPLSRQSDHAKIDESPPRSRHQRESKRERGDLGGEHR